MDSKVRVVVYADTAEAASVVEAALASVESVFVQTRIGSVPGVRAAAATDPPPDALILYLEENSAEALEKLAKQPSTERPPLIVLGAGNDPALVRLAMQAGARDILPLPVNRSDLLAAIARVARAEIRPSSSSYGEIIAFINAKGGCGATTLACNTAHAISRASEAEVCLLDFDLQFGDVPLYFDLQMQRDIVDALSEIDAIDTTAFSAYLKRHTSGVRVLGVSEERPITTRQFGREPIHAALTLARSMHGHVIVDLPRNIDDITNTVFALASRIVIVVQQLVPALRDARRMLAYLKNEADIDPERILLVVNRYDPEASVTLSDIAESVGTNAILCVPSDWALVSECINAGTTIFDQSPKSPVALALSVLQRKLMGLETPAHHGLLARALSGLGLRAAR